MKAAASRSAPQDAPDAAPTGQAQLRSHAEDSALLAALPIAAAIVGLTSTGILKLIERNPRFDEVIALTGDAAMQSGDFRQCMHVQIAQLMMAFLADFNAASELDFCDGEGLGSRHFRIKLAPLKRDEERGRPRCLTDAELAAVLAFIRAVPSGGAPTPSDEPGPYARLAIVMNELRPSIPVEKAAIRSAPEQVAMARQRQPVRLAPRHATGRHIAATVCAECHGSDLSGDATEGGPNLTVAGAYDREAFRRLLRTGIPPDGRDLGIMSEAAREDFRLFTDPEIDAIHAYLEARAQLP